MPSPAHAFPRPSPAHACPCPRQRPPTTTGRTTWMNRPSSPAALESCECAVGTGPRSMGHLKRGLPEDARDTQRHSIQSYRFVYMQVPLQINHPPTQRVGFFRLEPTPPRPARLPIMVLAVQLNRRSPVTAVSNDHVVPRYFCDTHLKLCTASPDPHVAQAAPAESSATKRRVRYYLDPNIGVHSSPEASLLKPHIVRCACRLPVHIVRRPP